jgi:hypothetical protein
MVRLRVANKGLATVVNEKIQIPEKSHDPDHRE